MTRVETLARMVQRAFGLRAGIVSGSQRSSSPGIEVFSLRLAPADQEVYLKIATSEATEAYVAAEAWSLQKLYALGLPVPELLYFEENSAVEREDLPVRPWFFMTRVRGRPLSEPFFAPAPEFLTELREHQRAWASIKGRRFGFLGGKKLATWPEAMAALLEKARGHLDLEQNLFERDEVRQTGPGSEVGVNFKPDFAFRKGLLEKAGALLEIPACAASLASVKIPRYVRAGFFPEDVFVGVDVGTNADVNGGLSGEISGATERTRLTLSGLVNWDEALFGDPLLDAALIDLLEAFMTGKTPDRPPEPRALLYKLYGLALFPRENTAQEDWLKDRAENLG